MQSHHDLPNGDRLWISAPDTVAAALPGIVELFRSGESEEVFFGNQRPEGAVISFARWHEYESLKAEAAADLVDEQRFRENLPPADRTPYEPRTPGAVLDPGAARDAVLHLGPAPVFIGADDRPEGVVISFDTWLDCEQVKADAEADRRRYDLVRERLADADDPTKWISFEDMMAEFGLDPDADDLEPPKGHQPS
ncbi:hypothetical protein HPO96_01960 [Kribbella sandramycini]|uniref:Uncharacterized protein n=1 Tax=Kribbella sandramycini TaxID=60450 RepID=A0A7Y4KWK5_9ACTN|nr:hypothetical protein [Kribbella sandramycini]MBB6568407.1 hypothetical protein [Kribbella sandramycini]NOL39001.1 hypothetical protein [Kribbella sandramycini]